MHSFSTLQDGIDIIQHRLMEEQKAILIELNRVMKKTGYKFLPTGRKGKKT